MNYLNVYITRSKRRELARPNFMTYYLTVPSNCRLSFLAPLIFGKPNIERVTIRGNTLEQIYIFTINGIEVFLYRVTNNNYWIIGFETLLLDGQTLGIDRIIAAQILYEAIENNSIYKLELTSCTRSDR